MHRRTFCLGLVGLLAGASCRSAAPALTNTRDSPEALAEAVLDALARRDRSALDALVLSEEEFRDHVWPALPAARPERNLPLSYVWGDLRQKSESALSGTLREKGGQRYDLQRISFAGMTEYPKNRVHRGAVLRVVDSLGQESDLRVCGSMLEQDGAWKVFSYVVD